MRAKVVSYSTKPEIKDQYSPRKGQSVIVKLIKKSSFRETEIEVLEQVKALNKDTTTKFCTLYDHWEQEFDPRTIKYAASATEKIDDRDKK
jgi:hypothetical protein